VKGNEALRMIACRISIKKEEELREGVFNLRRGTRRFTLLCLGKKSMNKELE
jgi:hypothetical protein